MSRSLTWPPSTSSALICPIRLAERMNGGRMTFTIPIPRPTPLTNMSCELSCMNGSGWNPSSAACSIVGWPHGCTSVALSAPWRVCNCR